jgi:hypothetical protein
VGCVNGKCKVVGRFPVGCFCKLSSRVQELEQVMMMQGVGAMVVVSF